jgi:chromosome segregation ATPase
MSNDDPHRAELAELRDVVHAGFARMDRYFELQQAQHVELRGEFQGLRGEFQELRGEVRELTQRVDRIEVQLASLQHEVSALRDHTTRELADIRVELRQLRQEVKRNAALRAAVDALTDRVTRLERDWDRK